VSALDDDLVEAVASALFSYWHGPAWDDVQANPIASQYRKQARAVLSVPALRDALARDAQVREELEVYRTALGLACSDGWSDGASAMESYIETARTRIAAARPEPDDSDIMPGSEFDGPVVL